MAFLDVNDKLNQNQNGQQPGQVQQTNGIVSGGTSGVVSGSGPGQGQIGTGGQGGGWTNIQNYLQANPGASSAGALNNQVGAEFDNEEKQARSQADDVKKQAQSTVDQHHLGDTAAAQMVNEAAQRPSQDINNKMSGYLNGQYNGPDSFSYGIGQKAQSYGSALNDDQGFKSLMGNLYNQSAGGNMTTGQMALQNQFDVNNPDLSAARSDLRSRYSALSDLANMGLPKEVSDAVSADKTQYSADAKDLNDYLTGMRGSIGSELDQMPNDSDKYAGLKGSKANQYNAISSFLGMPDYQMPASQTPAATAPTDPNMVPKGGFKGGDVITPTNVPFYGFTPAGQIRPKGMYIPGK